LFNIKLSKNLVFRRNNFFSFFFQLSLFIFVLLQACSTVIEQRSQEKIEIRGRFSLSIVDLNQSNQGRFIWKISPKNIEKFYLMDPWGNTHAVLIRDLNKHQKNWTFLNGRYQPVDDKKVENWLKKQFSLDSLNIFSFTKPINIASENIKNYFFSNKSKNRINIKTSTDLGIVIMNFLPDKQY
tara:strand:+ start:37 stop:585 length:549 start_codon:yes stop_codon:yes gene_type:complete